MMCLRSVCFAGAVTLVCVAAQMSVRNQNTAERPAMQKGIGVEMATANHAQAWPRADDNDAWVLTVDKAGRLYLGTDLMTPRELEKWMLRHPRQRDQKIYIKADARAAYASVEKALDAVGAVESPEPVLLVNRPDRAGKSGGIVPPEGLGVSVGSQTPSGTVATVVELLPSGREHSLVRIDNDEIAWRALTETLNRHFQKGGDKVVVLKANLHLPFAEVVHAIDNCRETGARVYLTEPEL